MAYFRNRAVNLLNLHFGICAMVFYGGGAFFFAYLLKAGFSPATVLVVFASVLVGRFLIRPAIIPLAVRWGVCALLIAGTLIGASVYPLLAEVVRVGPLLVTLCVVTALGDTLYWTSYHAYFAALGDHEHRGHQLGVREAIGAIVGIVSPLTTGWVLVEFGPRAAFTMNAVTQVLATLPLLGTPDLAVRRDVAGLMSAALPGMLMFLADGWIAAGHITIWQMGLFLTLGDNYLSYGGALAAAALVGAVGSMLLGRHIDAGHGKSAVWLALGLLLFSIALRATVLGHAAFAVIANALGALITCMYTPTLMTAVYNQSKRSPCPLRYQVATEGSWDVGGGSASLLSAFLLSRHAPLRVGILLSLVGATGSLLLLLRYYTRQEDGASQALAEPALELGGPH